MKKGIEFRFDKIWQGRPRGHFWVGDGPFYLHSVHPVERTLVLRRFEDFPDPAAKWLRFTEPQIPELDLTGPMLVQGGEPAEFELHSRSLSRA